MVTILQKLTVIFLVIVQLIAPLVHAHAGGKLGVLPATHFGSLHIPGLERYRISSAETMYCNIATHDFSSGGILVGINLGIIDRQPSAEVDLDNCQFLHQQALASNALAFSVNSQFFLPSQRFISRLSLSSLLPRAPPLQ